MAVSGQRKVSGQLGLALGASLAFFALAVIRLATLNSQAFDLAYFDQVVWNAANGHGFVSSFNPYPFFGQHFEPALAAFVPLYLLHPTPLWLLAGQSAALGLAVLPFQALAAGLVGPRLAWLAGAAYLLQLFVVRAVTFDFHTEALAVPFVFWAALAASQGQPRILLACGAVPLLCKEDGALVAFGVGLLAWTVWRRREGAWLMALAVAYAVAVTVVVMPALRGGAPSDIVLRYGYLGATVPAIAAGLVTRPGAVADHLFDPGGLWAVFLMLAGLAFLPVRRPLALVAAVPALALALLSDAPAQHQLLYQYGLAVGPLLVIAALFGWQRLGAGRNVGVAMLGMSVLVLLVAGPRISLGGWADRGDARDVLSHVPGRDSVAASRNLLPLLSDRSDIQQLPHPGSLDKTWVVVDQRQDPDAGAELPGRGYTLVAESGDFSAWRRRH